MGFGSPLGHPCCDDENNGVNGQWSLKRENEDVVGLNFIKEKDGGG